MQLSNKRDGAEPPADARQRILDMYSIIGRKNHIAVVLLSDNGSSLRSH